MPSNFRANTAVPRNMRCGGLRMLNMCLEYANIASAGEALRASRPVIMAVVQIRHGRPCLGELTRKTKRRLRRAGVGGFIMYQIETTMKLVASVILKGSGHGRFWLLRLHADTFDVSIAPFRSNNYVINDPTDVDWSD